MKIKISEFHRNHNFLIIDKLEKGKCITNWKKFNIKEFTSFEVFINFFVNIFMNCFVIVYDDSI